MEIIKMNSKPVLGLIAVAKKNQYKGEIYKLVDYYKTKLVGESSFEAIIENTVLFDESDIVHCAMEMEKKNVDLIIFFVGTWIFSSNLIAAVNDLHIPFILYGLSDQIANGNLGASLQIRYVLQEMGKKFLYLSGPIVDEENYLQIVYYLKAAWVKKQLRNRKVATIGGKCMMMYQTQVNEFNWKTVFGIDFPQYDTAQIFHEMEKVDENEAQAIAEDFLSKVDQVHWELETGETIAADGIVSQARMFLAFKRMKQLYQIDIFANKCMPEMSSEVYGYGYAGCLATCMLNEAGIITACEADVPAALSMYILSLLTGQTVFFADIARLNKPEKKVTFFNCGTAPISMADRKKGVSLWPIPANISDEAVPEEYFINHMKGASINFVLEEDRPATILRIGGNDKTLRFHVARVTTASRDVEPEEVLGNRWPGFGLKFKGDLDKFLNHTTGHHYSLVYGDVVEELRCLAQLYDIDFILDE
jgi:L-fucose isomerase-like protein